MAICGCGAAMVGFGAVCCGGVITGFGAGVEIGFAVEPVGFDMNDPDVCDACVGKADINASCVFLFCVLATSPSVLIGAEEDDEDDEDVGVEVEVEVGDEVEIDAFAFAFDAADISGCPVVGLIGVMGADGLQSVPAACSCAFFSVSLSMADFGPFRIIFCNESHASLIALSVSVRRMFGSVLQSFGA